MTALPLSAVPAIVLAHGPEPVAPLTWTRWLTSWEFDPTLAGLLVLPAALYLWGVRRLHVRGDRWPAARTAGFLAGGLGTVVVATMSSFGVYDDTLFSLHMIQHMLLAMVAPIFLALSAPITLALRTLPPGGRRAVLTVLHSRVASFMANPVVGLVVFLVSQYGVYYTDLYETSLRNDLVHELTHLHFLVSGCIFLWPLVGRDPLPKVAHVFRHIALVFTLLVHIILGLSLMIGARAGNLIAGDFYRDLGRDWGLSLVQDQFWAGGIMWAGGDLVALLFLMTSAVQWQRDDQREAGQIDRHLDRIVAGGRSLAASLPDTVAPIGPARRSRRQSFANQPTDHQRRATALQAAWFDAGRQRPSTTDSAVATEPGSADSEPER